MMNRRLCLLLCAMLLAAPVIALAHSGRTDANGGHYNRKTGEYHYHNGGTKKHAPTMPSPSEPSASGGTARPLPKPTQETADLEDVLVETDFPIVPKSPKPHIKSLQSVLIELGDLPGIPDGEWGRKTTDALMAAAARNGESQDGGCSYNLFLKLLDEAGDLDDAA